MTRRALVGLAGGAAIAAAQTSLDLLDLPAPKADLRLAYGKDPFQFGDLRLPAGSGPHPVVIYIHGGFWKSAYSLEHTGHACAALTRAGAATWNLEYRRIGNPGGGWPGTCQDVAAAAACLAQLAAKHTLDLDRVVVAGHSAGGHLACWLAGQEIKTLALRRVVALAGVVDLKRAWELKLSAGIMQRFLGGSPDEVPERYRAADPMQLLPMKTSQRLVHGTSDDVVPFEISQNFKKASRNAELNALPDTGHFELIDPRAKAWKSVERAVLDWS